MTTKTDTEATATTADERIGKIESAIEQLATLVTNMATAQATATLAPEPKGDTPNRGFKVTNGATPPLSGNGKTPKGDEPDKRTTNLQGPVTFKQLKALSGLTAPALDGRRVVYIGPEGSEVREYWEFLTKQEASDAISALKVRQAYEFSNGLTIAPR